MSNNFEEKERPEIVVDAEEVIAEPVLEDDFLKEREYKPPQEETKVYTKKTTDSNKAVEEEEKSTKVALIIGAIIAALLLLYAFVQPHMNEISENASNIVMGVLGVGCLYLIIRYFRVIKRVLRLAKMGNTLMAKKAAISAFIPMLASANLAIYNFVNSAFVQDKLEFMSGGIQSVRAWLYATTPDKAPYIYYGTIAVLALLLNSIVIKNFRRVLKVGQIIARQ